MQSPNSRPNPSRQWARDTNQRDGHDRTGRAPRARAGRNRNEDCKLQSHPGKIRTRAREIFCHHACKRAKRINCRRAKQIQAPAVLDVEPLRIKHPDPVLIQSKTKKAADSPCSDSFCSRERTGVAFSRTRRPLKFRYFSSSIVTATAALAESRTLLPSTSATRPPSMK
jgi:hypothetical protein